MSNSEEKIKAFFNDEEKVKALVSDEEFIEKVSGGTATPETYKETFGKLGLELNGDECKEVNESVSKILSIPMEKLEESKLEDISGGLSDTANSCIKYGGAALAITGPIAGIGCSIASAVCSSKARKALQKGDTKNADKYAKTAKNLSVSSASLCAGAPIVGLIAFGVGDCLQFEKENSRLPNNLPPNLAQIFAGQKKNN